MIFGGKSNILTKKAGANITVGFFACSSTSILVTSLHQTRGHTQRSTFVSFVLLPHFPTKASLKLDEHSLLIPGSLAETELSSTRVLFPMLSEMKTSFKVLRLYTAPSAAECSL